MTTAVLVPPSPVTVASASSAPSAKSAPTDVHDADEIRNVEEHYENGSNSKRPTAAPTPPTACVGVGADVDENANTSNTVTRAATNRLKRCKSTPSATADAASIAAKQQAVKRRRVSFESAEIVEFEPTVFTTTVTSGGIPVGMSLTERSRSRRRLDSWELEREDLRVGRQNYMEEGYLDPSEREVILNNAGCAEQSMQTAEAEVNQIIAHRRESNEVDFDFLYGLVSIGEGEEDEEEDEEDGAENGEEEQEDEEIEEVTLMSNIAENQYEEVVER